MRDFVPVRTGLGEKIIALVGGWWRDWMGDWRVLVLGLVAGDGSYVAALVIDVDLAGGRIRQQIPFVGRWRIWIRRHVDDGRRRGSGRRRCRGASRNRDRQKQWERGSRNPWIHDASVIRAGNILMNILSPSDANRKQNDRSYRALFLRDAENFAEVHDCFFEAGTE